MNEKKVGGQMGGRVLEEIKHWKLLQCICRYQETEKQILGFGIGSSIVHVQVYPILHAGKNSHVPHPPPLSLLICQCLGAICFC